MNTAKKLLAAGAFAVFICSCAKLPQDFLLDNPRDTSGTNWHPPRVTAMNDTVVDINDSLTVTAVGTDDNGTIARYIWARNGATFMDTTTTGALKVAWAGVGRRVVRVKVRDNDGVISLPDSCVIQVTQTLPVVTAMNNTTVDINDSLTITASATDNGTIAGYLWAISGAAYLDTTTTGELRVAWPTIGMKVVRVAAVDNDGLVSLPDSCWVQVTQSIPVVTARSDTSIDINDSISITAVGTDNQSVVRYIWARNGTAYLDTTVSGSLPVAWSTIGRKVVRVVAVDNDGLISLPDSCVVQVTQSPPAVSAMNDTALVINDSITVTAIGTDNQSVMFYVWAINGTIYADTTTSGALTVAWPDTGRNVVRVRAIDNDGLLSPSDSCIVLVTLGIPVVTAMNDTGVYINDSLTITAAGVDNGSILNYLWARDGATYADTTTTGTLLAAWGLADTGSHVVLVKVLDDDSLVSEPDTCVVLVSPGFPVVKAMNDTSIEINDSVTVTAAGSDTNGNIVNYFWAIDGATYADTTTTASLSVAWPDTGRKVVRVKVMDDDSLISAPDSCVLRVTPLNPPRVTAMADTSVAIYDSFYVYASGSDSGGTIVKYLWALDGVNFSDSTDSGRILTAFDSAGVKTVKVKVRDNDTVESIADSIVITVHLYTPLVIAMADTSVAVNDSFYIRAVGTDTNGTVVKYLWALDGVTFSDSTDSGRIRTAFDTVGVKTIRVMVLDDDSLVSGADSLRVTVMDASPINLSPADSEAVATVQPTLRWMRGMGDTSFTVLLDTFPVPADTAAAEITDTSFTPAAPLQNGRTCYWQIIGHYASGDAAGEVWQFMTPAAGPTFTTHPVSQSVIVGDPVSFPVAATGTGTVHLQWQRSDDDGMIWTDISGETGITLDFTATLADSGAQFRVIATDDAGSTISNVAILSVSASASPVVPYSSDANTILLDHFNGSTSASITGYVVGSGCGSTWPTATPTYSYNAGQSGLNQALTLGPPAGQPAGSASYLRYPTMDILSLANGTLEFWIYLPKYGVNIADHGQYYQDCADWTLGLWVDSSGHLSVSSWGLSGGWTMIDSLSIVPLNTWTHIAVTWGGTGAKMYINGVQVKSDPSTDYPAAGFSDYLMMRLGTNAGASCAIDELRISNIQRTTFNVP